ncbi:MAG TPA: hypothetical protein VMT79_20380, partial [Candidatus Binatia bacterium]|nr:hypothetical protein [Candidatus Binatia bacterium]
SVICDQEGVTRPCRGLTLQLIGLAGTPTAEVRLRQRADQSGRFRFEGVTPGGYVFTDSVGSSPKWRLRVEIEAARETLLDLTPSNSAKVRNDFPRMP